MNYGLNYMGSKNTISQELAQYMLNRHPTKDIFIDMTMGGGAMTHYILRETEGINVIANDLNPYFTDLYRMMMTNPDVVKQLAYSWCTREGFIEIMKNPARVPKWKVAVATTIWSFGGSGESYLYGNAIEDIKYNIYQAVMNNLWSDDLLDFKNTLPKSLLTNTNIDFTNKRLEIVRLYGEYRGEQFYLENLNRAERLVAMTDDFYNNRHRLVIMTNDYKDLLDHIAPKYLNRAIVYIDPPYENTSKYMVNQIDYDVFWGFVKSLKDELPVYVSSYNAPDDITMVWESGKSVVIGSAKNRKTAMERLYYNDYATFDNSLFDLLS